MTKKFYEIVLTTLIKERDLFELELMEVYDRKNLSIKERVDETIDIIGKLTDINNNIQTLTSIFVEDVNKNEVKK